MEHSVNIPEWALLTIAVHGNMGDGELPDMMKFWARDECKRLGPRSRSASRPRPYVASPTSTT